MRESALSRTGTTPSDLLASGPTIGGGNSPQLACGMILSLSLAAMKPPWSRSSRGTSKGASPFTSGFRIRQWRSLMATIPCHSLDCISPPVGGVILVDLSWLLHRCYHASPDLTAVVNGKTVFTGAVHGTLRCLQAAFSRAEDHAMILCMDGNPVIRKEVFPGYKGGRDKTNKTEIYSASTPVCAMATLIPGVIAAYHPDFEADDVIWTLSQKFKHLGPVKIYSRDNDLHQCLDKEVGPVTMFEKFHKREFVETTEDDTWKKWGVGPRSVAMFRSLTGDNSDNLKGFYRFPKKFAAQIALKFPTLRNFLDSTQASKLVLTSSPAQVKRIHQILDELTLLKRNYFLMKLMDVPRPALFTLDPRIGKKALVDYQMQGFSKVVTKFCKRRATFVSS